ncbi:uncharacterized protein LOC125524888 [Triticum urartu]|uniref:uncharacterized protein LOC125524869 n=1 Tax=Triticum urartu TaxID=4572 RepID=UPI0020430D2E|nr:uncharacterized protein LOC125524869 [Triticum urartu]XP_048545879.1 uncharacterized protein LOC125524888 [Triticum urartu]
MAMDLQRPQPLHLGFPDPSSLGWAEQPWRRIRSVHGRSTSGSADHGQRPDGGGYRRGCCSALHVSSCASGGQTLLRLRPRGTLIVGGFIFLRSDSVQPHMVNIQFQKNVLLQVTTTTQAKSNDKNQLDEGIHLKHISNLLCVGSFF